jgi:hypothetical protein
MHWSDLENTQPRLARLGHERLIRPGVVLVATIRQDGTARLSPVEPLVMDGDLWLFKVRGTARVEDDPAVQRRYADTVAADLGWNPQPGRFHLFAADIGQVTFINYDTPTGDQHVAMWPPGREFIRRATSPTSVGDPEPVSDLIKTG